MQPGLVAAGSGVSVTQTLDSRVRPLGKGGPRSGFCLREGWFNFTNEGFSWDPTYVP